ncbi:MAG: diguanylate cyclase [Cetobacterium sp.]
MFKSILDEHKNGIMILNQNLEVEYANNILKKIFTSTEGKRCGEFLECIHQNIEKKRCLETTKCQKCNIKYNIYRVISGEIANISIENIEYEALLNNKKEKIFMSIEIKKNQNFIIIEFFKLKTKENLLISDRRVLDEMLDNLEDYIFCKDTLGRYIYGNKAFCKSLNVEKINLIGKKDLDLFDKNTVQNWIIGDNKALEKGEFIGEEKVNGKYLKVTKQRLDLDNETLLICTVKDITYEKKEREKAYIDSLTGVGNRRAYNKKIEKIFTNKKNNYNMALLDLDYLREINNQWGHTNGDLALKVVVESIKNSGIKYLYRIGGDEFAFLIDSELNSLEICEKIIEEIQKFKIGNKKLSASIGLTNLKLEDSITDNFNLVDKALYESKKSGRGKITIFRKGDA